MISILAFHALSEYYWLKRKPPVTAGLLAANTLAYLRPSPLDILLPTINRVWFNPHLILKATYSGKQQIATLKYSDRSCTVKLGSHGRGWGAFFFFWLAHICQRSSSACRRCLCVRAHRYRGCVFRVYISTSAGWTKQSKCQVSPHEQALHGPTSPQPPSALEKTGKFELEYPF